MLVCVLPRALRLLDNCMVKLSADKSYPSVAVEEGKKGSFKSEVEIPGNIFITRRVCSNCNFFFSFPFLYLSSFIFFSIWVF